MSKDLKNTQLNKLLGKRHDKAFPLKDRDSLGVLVGKKGGIRWQYRFRINGKAQRLLMGLYPEMSIAEARGYIPKIQNWLSLGQDPRVEWKKLFTPEVEAKGITLVELCEKWFDAYAQTNLKEKTTNNYLCHLEVWVYNKPRRKVLDEPWALNNFACPFDSIPNEQWFPYFDWITRNSSGTIFIIVTSWN